MSAMASELRPLAKLIVVSAPGYSASECAPYRVYDFATLQASLTSLMGRGGFRMLLGNALARAQSDVPWLREVSCKSDGSLIGLEAASAGVTLADYHKSQTDILTHILVLLLSYIGPGMTRMIVLENWPYVAEDDITFGRGS